MFIPVQGSEITVALPGEKLRVNVVRVINAHAIVVEITSQPMTKGHMFRRGDVVGCKRVHNGLEEVWQAMDDRQFLNVAPKAVAAKRKKKVAA